MTEVDWPDIIRQHGPIVWKTAYRLVGNAEHADDCYQETFADAVRQAAQDASHRESFEAGRQQGLKNV